LATLFNEDLEVLGVPVNYFPLGIRLSIGDICFVALILMVLGLAIRRFLQSKARQREMTADLEQAQEVQHLLVPDDLPQMPGYRVEGTNLPASQVGGDFYQVIPSANGGLIVLLGDVSGKGLRAAMVVSLAVGALRAIVKETSKPAEILTRLNRELAGNLRSGFVTCVCTHLQSSGMMTIANAGHLAPWVNSEEIATPGMLPLGVMAAGVEYTEETFQLKIGDRVTLLSDGVVESRCERDGALFGFDRLQLLLAENPSADSIAREAQRFGQEDDISVVSIRRMKA
jgi:serine phosphatase RsbU (regulator of sigma subunit)